MQGIETLLLLIAAWFITVGVIKLALGDRAKTYYLLALVVRSNDVEGFLRPLANALSKIPTWVIFTVVTAFFILSMAYAIPVLVPLPIQVVGPGGIWGFVPSMVRMLYMNTAAVAATLMAVHTVSGAQAAQSLAQRSFTPAAPLIPGLTIGIETFVMIIIALGLSILVHEASHGAVAIRHGGRVKSGGFFASLFILYGGFVEVDEEDLRAKAGLRGVLSMIGAGVFSNMVLSIVAVALLSLALIPPLQPYLSGVIITGVVKGSPAYQAGLPVGGVILSLNGKPVVSTLSMLIQLLSLKPGDVASLAVYYNGAVKSYVLTLGHNPQDPSLPFIGVALSDRAFYNFVYWLWTMNVIIILLNTMPAWPLDGGQFLYHLILSIPGVSRRGAGIVMNVVSMVLWGLFILTLAISLTSGLWRIAVTPP